MLLLCVVVVLASCSEDETTPELNVAFSNLTANGSTTETTTALTLTFDKAIEGLTAEDITLTAGETSATKGALTDKGNGVYELAVSGITKEGSVTVAVAKTGYEITPTSQDVTVSYYFNTIFYIQEIHQILNEGFYDRYDLTWVNGKVTHLKKQRYTPADESTGPAKDYDVQYKDGNAYIPYDGGGYEKHMAFTLNANGFVTKMEDVDISEVTPYVEMTFTCKYDTDGSLKQIHSDDEDMNLFDVTFNTEGNWATYWEPMAQATGSCVASKNKNTASLDVNLLLLTTGNIEMIDYAIMLGFFPRTPEVLSSLTIQGDILNIIVEKEGMKITGARYEVEGEAARSYKFVY